MRSIMGLKDTSNYMKKINKGENMKVNENVITYNISAHCKTRYAERIMGKEDIDVNRFVTLNEDKIKTDINKMIEHGILIYSGKQTQKDNKGRIIDVYLQNCWIILVDEQFKNVITLYKIDLGLDEEFNKSYVSKMVEKLNAYKEVYESVRQQVQEESNTYKEMIVNAETQIKEYRSMIKNLEELCVAYKTVIENNSVKVAQVNKDVVDVLNTLIGKKEF